MTARPTVISGVVEDSGRKAVQGARVYFSRGPEPLPDVAILTGSDGGFELSAPVPGTYTIECYADGFQQATLNVTVAGIRADDLTFRLTPAK